MWLVDSSRPLWPPPPGSATTTTSPRRWSQKFARQPSVTASTSQNIPPRHQPHAGKTTRHHPQHAQKPMRHRLQSAGSQSRHHPQNALTQTRRGARRAGKPTWRCWQNTGKPTVQGGSTWFTVKIAQCKIAKAGERTKLKSSITTDTPDALLLRFSFIRTVCAYICFFIFLNPCFMHVIFTTAHITKLRFKTEWKQYYLKKKKKKRKLVVFHFFFFLHFSENPEKKQLIDWKIFNKLEMKTILRLLGFKGVWSRTLFVLVSPP